MNASMARRIRNAESVLITAIDRERNRDWSHPAQTSTQRTPRPVKTGIRTGALHTRKVA
jgi:hypothetical protein